MTHPSDELFKKIAEGKPAERKHARRRPPQIASAIAPHRAAREIQYLASFLDGKPRIILDTIAEDGLKYTAEQKGTSESKLESEAAYLLKEAFNKMRACMGGQFQVSKIFESEIRERKKKKLHYQATIRSLRAQLSIAERELDKLMDFK